MASGSIQIKSGTYYAVLNMKDANGKRKQKWVSTKLEANSRNRRKAEAFLDNLLNAKNVDGDDLAEYAKEWVRTIRFTTDPVTYQGYRSAAELHIIPYFEQNPIDIQDAVVRDVQRFQTFLLTRGNSKTGGPLSAKSVRNFMTVLSLIFEDAITMDLIATNPVKRIKKPPKNPPKVSFYSMEQTKKLFNAIHGHRLEDLILIATLYGLRKSEVLGLKWDAVDFENKRVTIKRTVTYLYGTIEKEKTKTKSSYRTYPLLPVAEDIFRRQARLEALNREKYGSAYHDTDYIFKWDDGRLFAPRYINEAFTKILKRNNLPQIRFHDLRHTCASMMIEQGRNLKDVQVWLGHSDIQTTGNVYGHLTNKHLVEVGNQLSDALFA